MQQWRHGCCSGQCECVRQQAAVARGMIAKMAGSQHACGSGQQMRCACNSVQRHQRVCGSRQERPEARLQWETVMAAASRRHNYNGQRQRRRQRQKGRRDGRKIAMNNNYGNGQLWVKAGIGGRSGLRCQPTPPPPPPNQIITGN